MKRRRSTRLMMSQANGKKKDSTPAHDLGTRRKGKAEKKQKKKKAPEIGENDPWYRKFVPVHDTAYANYMEEEWGYPVMDDTKLFEMLILEGAQAGLSWAMILKKREGYRNAFHNFDIPKVASMTQSDIDRLCQDPSIVRNKLKIRATVKNAKSALQVIEEHGSLSAYLWSFVNNEPIVGEWRSFSELPNVTAEAEAMSKALKKKGFSFVGPTICYAFMQACGMVVDHPVDTPQHHKVVAWLRDNRDKLPRQQKR